MDNRGKTKAIGRRDRGGGPGETGSDFEPFLALWRLTVDGAPIVTRGSRLLPVVHDGKPAMLKISHEAEERFGFGLMAWWDGEGAARVLARHHDAILMELAAGGSLVEMVADGRDDEATAIICATVRRLHQPKPAPLPDLVPLAIWFRALAPRAASEGGILAVAAAAARDLLAAPRDVVPLHGDIHHGNILDFGGRGFLAIDPKALHGERGFDYANLFRNPDHRSASSTSMFESRLAIVSGAAMLDRRRLLQWILAYSGLSAAWLIGDGAAPESPLGTAHMAAAALQLL